MKFSELKRAIGHMTDRSDRTSDRPTRRAEIGLLEFFGDEEADLSQPRYNSADVLPGDAFFAIRGYTTDGHKYIAAAIERGARTIVLDEPNSFTLEDARAANVNRLVVDSSRRALALISEAVFGNPSSRLRMIGVTGTNGKTTVTTIIKQLLEAHGEKVGLIGTVGITIGSEEIEATHTTPESRDISELLARMLSQDVTTCVMEVSSHALHLDRVAALDFDIAVFTNLTQDHLDFHKTMEDYFLAKEMLFTQLKDVAVAVSNADDPFGERMIARTVATSHTYGVVDDANELQSEKLGHADLLASDISLGISGTSFTVRKRYSEEHASIHSNLVGSFNVENLLAAIAALYFGVEGFSLEVLAQLVPKVRPVRGRFETVRLSNGATAIIDYAHTPDALENVLRTIRTLQDPGTKLITVFGCGGDRDKSKRPIMGRIAAELSDRVIITSDNPRSEKPEAIIAEVLKGVAESRARCVENVVDRISAIRKSLDASKAGDVILIAGKGHETYQIVGSTKHHLDDREQVQLWETERFGPNSERYERIDN